MLHIRFKGMIFVVSTISFYVMHCQGHIALGSAVFPEGTTGSRLDSFARRYLWGAGLDYNHGTGHGVGAFLNVRSSREFNVPNDFPSMCSFIV